MAKPIKKSELYEKMVTSERDALLAQENLLNGIKDWLSNKIDEDVADTTKIILAAGGYIQIRTTKPFEDELLKSFLDVFNFSKTWFREEQMTDYRNVEEVKVTIYEYGFIPRDINKIVGENQVDLKEVKEDDSLQEHGELDS